MRNMTFFPRVDCYSVLPPHPLEWYPVQSNNLIAGIGLSTENLGFNRSVNLTFLLHMTKVQVKVDP